MKILFVLLLMNGILGSLAFGTSYLKNSELCKPWSCINTKLGLQDGLPDKANYAAILKGLLPESWQDRVASVVEVCFSEDKPRRYTNTCPGQALLHCVVDSLIDNCPEEYQRKDDSCAPLSCLAGFKYMFSQSRYRDLEKNLPKERRPVWFLKNYFSSKCCDLPALFNSETLAQCNLTTMVHYYDHDPKPVRTHFDNKMSTSTAAPVKPRKDTVKVVNSAESDDILDCCDISGFITPASRSDCDFQLSWDNSRRLAINAEDVITTTSTAKPLLPNKHHDVKVMPLSCDQETCVFSKLNVIKESGTVDKDAFSKILDNFTKEYPEWQKAKARVVTRCLSKPTKDYQSDCEINKVLACTFDVLSENCPHMKKPSVDPCKHTHALKNDTVCQINSSKFRAKNRRQYCDFPRFVDHNVLVACGVNSVSRIEQVLPQNEDRMSDLRKWVHSSTCKESTPPVTCLMSKMGLLNKYNFMDSFRMTNRIRQYTLEHKEWRALTNVYLATLTGMPMYDQYCASSRKLLNVIDAMIMTCPLPLRKTTQKCDKLFNDMIKHRPNNTEERAPHTYHDKPHYHAEPKNSYFNTNFLRERHIPPVKLLAIKPTRMVGRKRDNVLIRSPDLVVQGTNTNFDVPSSLLRHDPIYRPLNSDPMMRSVDFNAIEASAKSD